jgi:hypothetical protein
MTKDEYKQLYEQVCEQYDVLAKELEAINRQVEILSDALAESRREVAALKDVPETDFGNMTKDEALDLALEALECLKRDFDADQFEWEIADVAITAIKQARSAPVQEPVGFFDWYDNAHWGNEDFKEGCHRSWNAAIKYTTPPAAPVQEPVLQDIEQYRLQMAGISTAAIGYWKESDGIHPDYDTPALRDVAKLYAKYDALYTAAQPATEESSATQPAQRQCGDDK